MTHYWLIHSPPPLKRKLDTLNPNHATGFTLIETMITLMLIGVMFAIAAPSYLTWVNNKRVDDALIQVVGALKEAQSEALRKGKGCFVDINNPPGTIRATTIDASPVNCLPTGNRDLTTSQSNLQITTDFRNTPPPTTPDLRLIFTSKKTTPNPGIIVISQSDVSRQRCVVVSAGIGIIRTGYYQGDPSAPVIGNCSREP